MKLQEPFRLGEIADYLGASLKGDPEFRVTGLNEIHKVDKGDMTFVDNEKYYNIVLNSAASVILIDQDIEQQDGKQLLVSQSPFDDFNKLVKRFRPFVPNNEQVSATASIDEGTVIQPGAVIGHHVTIGKNCIIHPNVSIGDRTEIGDNVVIHPNTSIGGEAFYYQRQGGTNYHYQKLHSCGKVVIEDDVEMGSGCTIDRGVSGQTRIGKGTKMDGQVHIGHGAVVGKHCLFAAQVGVAGKTIIGDRVVLWGQVGVSKDLHIGDNVEVYAQSGVGKSLPANNTYFGSPAVEASKKWRQLALIRKLPEMWEKLKTTV